jgi:hypothetical protein
MHIISHRVNTIASLKKTSKTYGVEVDIRSFAGTLILHHDPLILGEAFEEWIKFYDHGTLILNVKEEGLEIHLLELMYRYNIENFFFLDQSFPFLRKTAFEGESRCAVRVSEYEDINTALSLSGLIDWAWIDCFSNFPLSLENAESLQNAGFKLCIVSPELQGRGSVSEILRFRNHIQLLGIKGDAVCTKHADLWD